jgi:hypothetical protein
MKQSVEPYIDSLVSHVSLPFCQHEHVSAL